MFNKRSIIVALFALSTSIACMGVANGQLAVSSFIDRRNKKTAITIHTIDGRVERWDCKPLVSQDPGIMLMGFDHSNTLLTYLTIQKNGNVSAATPKLNSVRIDKLDPLITSDIKWQSAFIFFNGDENWNHAHITTIKGLHTLMCGLASVTITLQHKEN